MMVSELCDGSVHALVHSTNDVPLRLWLRIAHDVCAGLAYLHSRGPPIVHRDLSSSNILLTAPLSKLIEHVDELRWPVAKLSDFGLSRVMDWYLLRAHHQSLTCFLPTNAHIGACR
jgi:serine/threonine protein kinase